MKAVVAAFNQKKALVGALFVILKHQPLRRFLSSSRSYNVPAWQECSGFSAMYRTPDGTCNNFQRPSWGSSFMPFLRFLPPDYSDGIEQFRRSG